MSERGSNPRRPTLAQSLRRHQEIVADHDGAGLTFAEIAEKHRVGEKEVREAYARYVEELAPLMAPTASAATVARYLQELQDVRRELRRIARFADNDSARVGALREAVRTMA